MYSLAYYGECLHTTLPIEQGRRLVLQYDLVQRSELPLLKAPDQTLNNACLRKIQSAVKQWISDPQATKLIIPLEHKYTETGLVPACLLGRDRTVFSSLCELGSVQLLEAKA